MNKEEFRDWLALVPRTRADEPVVVNARTWLPASAYTRGYTHHDATFPEDLSQLRVDARLDRPSGSHYRQSEEVPRTRADIPMVVLPSGLMSSAFRAHARMDPSECL